MWRLPRRLLLWVGAAAIAATGFTFMASNTIDHSNAGEASQVVSGYHVYNLEYSGVALQGNPNGDVGSMVYLGAPTDNHGISEQDGISTVSFQLSPDNAHWAAVQLYDSNKNVIGGGGASNCKETAGVWTCNVTSNSNGAIPVSQINWIDVEAVQ